MRFIVMGMATKEWEEAAVPPTAEQFAAMQKYNEELAKAGILLAAEGLAPTSKGARVKFSGDKRTVIDGPFTETKEIIGGYAIGNAKSKAHAIELAKRFLEVVGEGESEVRLMHDVAAFDAKAS